MAKGTWSKAWPGDTDAGIYSQLFAPYWASQVKPSSASLFSFSTDAEEQDASILGEAWLLLS